MRDSQPVEEYGQLVPKLIVFGVIVGVIAGIGAILFRAMIGGIHNLAFFGIFSLAYDANQHTLTSPFGLFIVLVPVAGALGVAWLVKTFAPEAKGHGVPEVIGAIYYQKGRIRPSVALVKSLASALSIGTGGSVGREGPIIQIGAAFGSTLAQWTHLPEWQRIALIACGAGGGIAATFNTPLGGILFAVELIMTEISPRTLAPMILSVVTATAVGRLYFGDSPSFVIPSLELGMHQSFAPEVLVAYLILGVIQGLGAVVLIRGIYGFEDFFERLPGNYYSRHAAGMLLVGLLMLGLHSHYGHYYVQGVGYATIQDILDGQLTAPGLLLILLVAKLLATSLTLGSGASGGVFSPSMFIGACLGAAFAYAVRALFPELPLDPIACAVMGMAGMVAGGTGAALTIMVMILEMTHEYQAVLPLILVVGAAHGMRRLIMQDNLYSMKLSRRGQPVPQSLHTPWMLLRSIGDLADTPTKEGAKPLRDSACFHQVLRLEGEVRALWPAGGPKAIPALVQPPDTPVFDAVAHLRSAGAAAVVITATGRPQDPALAALTLEEIAHHGHVPPAYLRPRRRQRR
ncbi:chloride channel protein [Thiorhodococcus mannitoliphagus]|uniref:Chloride channel protein n=1 Tax=Thiorhodococcus mannitoliphagus TaxID=329406 RepID=A0A6P1E4F9_9GAMM|nr:chloride channel protein [Thiorhodococcus mannitoliphagus]NEX23422.1 chloride channel protein [Thiorhodococcus mannitoliphagus]